MEKLDDETMLNLARARMGLMSRPKWAFLGGLVMSLTPLADETIQLAGVTSNGILVLNPVAFNQLSRDLQKSVIAHEVLHPAFKHHDRVGTRNQLVFNIAGDVWINAMLVANELQVDKDWVTHTGINAKFGLNLPDDVHNTHSTEMIYELLMAAGAKSGSPGKYILSPNGGKVDGGSIGSDMIGSKDAEKGMGDAGMGDSIPENVDWDTVVIGASRVAEDGGAGMLPGSEKNRLGLQPPRVRWANYISQFFSQATSGMKWSYKRPRRRFQHLGLTLPGTIPENPDIAIILDTSYSMFDVKDKVLGEFVTCQRYTGANVWFLAGDTRLQQENEVKRGRPYPQAVHGWGGTEFDWAFEHIRKSNRELGGIIFATDGYANGNVPGLVYPKNRPSIPTMWLIYDNKNFVAPFGFVVHVPNLGT